MKLFENYYQKRAERQVEEDRHEAIVKSKELFQLKESEGDVWITYDGNLVCPESMLNCDAVEAVKKMRELYIRRYEAE